MTRTLLVTNDKLSIKSFEKVLKRYEYTIAGSVYNVKDVPQMIRETQPEVILIDITSHGTIENICMAVDLQKLYPIPIVFFSALNIDESDIEKLKLDSTWILIKKPISTIEFLDQLDNLLHKIRGTSHV